MSIPEAFLLLSGLAYFAFAVLPEPCTFNLSKWVERVTFSAVGLVILLSLWLSTPPLYVVMGVLYVLALSLSYLGYVTWRVLWSEEPDSVVQVAMWLWDMGIALSFFLLSLR